MPEEKDQDAWLIERPVAQNNWTQAKSDLATAMTLFDAGIYYAAVFFGQQTAEKALRAACIVRLQKIRAAITSFRARTLCTLHWR